MPTFSHKPAKLIFASAAVLLLLLSYVLYRQIDYHLTAYREINKANVIKLKLERTLSALKDAENAQRGYLLTHDSSFLKPYEGARTQSNRLIKEIRNLTVNHTEQAPHLNALSTFIDLRFNSFHTVINQYNTPELNQETRKQHLFRGQSVSDSIYRHIRAILANEDNALKQLENERDRYNFMTPFYIFLLISSAIGIIAFSYFKIIQALDKSKRFSNKLKKLNRELKKKNHELELYNKELDSFSYIASHDLREPLRKIMTFSGMIMDIEADKLSSVSLAHFQRIRQAAQRMQNLLNDLLVYSHASEESRSFEWVDLNEILQHVSNNLSEEIRETNATIEVKKQLPLVKGLPFQLSQLFENLIINSLKYRQENEPPHITITSARVSRHSLPVRNYKNAEYYYKITLSDNGLGFEPAYAEKIFELFQRVHQAEKTNGTGIGLTICKKIMQNHNGFITARGMVNQGATFEIYLPDLTMSVPIVEEGVASAKTN